jgi:diguanylate cyclase (GGDEF)-like protein/PAS domain S-box-containing protein
MNMTNLLKSRTQILITATLTGLVYYFLARLGIALSSPPEYIASFWPPNTVILAALLFTDRRYWWIFLLVAAPTNIIPNIQAGSSIERALIFYSANITEVLIAAFSLKYFLGNQIQLTKLRDMTLFLLCAVLFAPMISAFIASSVSFNEIGVKYWLVWRIWFLSDALGHLALTPVIILFINSGLSFVKGKSLSNYIEAALLILSVIIIGSVSVGAKVEITGQFPALLYAPIPILLWAALRFGPKGICVSVLIITILSIWHTVNGRGSFIAGTPAENALSLQLFLVAISVPMMLLSALFSEHKQTLKKISEGNKRFKTSFNDAPIGMALESPEHIIIDANQSLSNMLGFSNEELIGSSFKDITHENDIPKCIEYHERLISGDIANYTFEKRYIHKQGHDVWGLLSVSLVENDDESSSYTIAQIQDVTQSKQTNELLTYQASHDSLTGLVNRREFERRTERLLSTVQEDSKKQHALCFLDLDQFKVVNDTCGHTAGDEMLKQISTILQCVIRHRDTLARLGGDEFGVLMEYCSLDDAHRVASSLQKAIQEFNFSWEEHTFKVGVSIGLVPITNTIPSLNELLKEADTACYIAKDKGRNRIHVYHAEDSEIAKHHGEMQWVERLYQALDDDRFCLYAQTISSLNNNKDTHYELLIRMINEQNEMVNPSSFLPAAERYNLISRIDLWVIEKTFSLLQNNPDFLEKTDFCSINLSGPSLTDRNILDFIIELLESSKIDPSKICFEITETAAISNLTNATKFIKKLKSYGCRFSLDDFGSGLSSFAYLKNLPVDYLKIDGMFVKDIVDDPIDHAMVKSINEIGHVMNMKTIAEFVENDKIKEMVKEIGVNYGQGYGIGKPQPFENLLNIH